jgi:hypothetical protein
MLLNVITVRSSPVRHLSLDAHRVFHQPDPRLASLPNLIPNSRPQRQCLISQQEQKKSNNIYPQSISEGVVAPNCAPNLLIPVLVNEQPATIGYPTDGSVGEVAEMPGTFNFGRQLTSQFENVAQQNSQ